MSFPNVIYGDHGFEKSVSTTKKNRIGTKLILPDGREFFYSLAGEAITAGKITMSATEPASDHDTDLAVASAAAAVILMIFTFCLILILDWVIGLDKLIGKGVYKS